MTEPRRDLRDDLLAATAARRELTPEDESYLVENFLAKLDREIESRIDARIDARLASMPRKRGIEAWVVPAALGIAIPLCSVGAVFAQGWGLLVAALLVVSVLAIYVEYNQR